VYKGWIVRVYIDKSVNKVVVDKLLALDVEVLEIVKGLEGKHGGMFWRFLVADDPSVSAMRIVHPSSSIGTISTY
jgi:hypothetical protein